MKYIYYLENGQVIDTRTIEQGGRVKDPIKQKLTHWVSRQGQPGDLLVSKKDWKKFKPYIP